jgi:hypothetical protein
MVSLSAFFRCAASAVDAVALVENQQIGNIGWNELERKRLGTTDINADPARTS